MRQNVPCALRSISSVSRWGALVWILRWLYQGPMRTERDNHIFVMPSLHLMWKGTLDRLRGTSRKAKFGPTGATHQWQNANEQAQSQPLSRFSRVRGAWT